MDSHAHLQRVHFADDLEDVFTRIQRAGLSGVILVAADDGSSVYDETVEQAERRDWLWMVSGVHPHCASAFDTLWPAVLRTQQHPKCVGLGEFGLDYHYDFSPRPVQTNVMRRQMDYAVAELRPIVLHVREAHQEALAILDEFGREHRGVVHCFSAGPEEAVEYLKRGLYLSFPGIVTYPKASDVQAAAVLCPLDRLLLETDSPYLAPVPYRGHRNEPAYLPHSLHTVAALRGVSPEILAEITARNTRQLFGIPL